MKNKVKATVPGTGLYFVYENVEDLTVTNSKVSFVTIVDGKKAVVTLTNMSVITEEYE